MKIIESKLKGAYLIQPDVFGDERGFFMEIWNKDRFSKDNLHFEFKQDNLSKSSKGVLRGLHFQNPHAQGKFVYVISGEVYDVFVDIRKGSPTFGQAEGYFLNEDNKSMLYVPEGFAHGFLVTSETAIFSYKCTDTYHPEAEHSILWNDPDLKIDWPLDCDPQLSGKDQKGIKLSDFPTEKLPVYQSN